MTHLPDKLRLKEMAEEDIYFARLDRELIRALKRRHLDKSAAAARDKNRGDDEARDD